MVVEEPLDDSLTHILLQVSNVHRLFHNNHKHCSMYHLSKDWSHCIGAYDLVALEAEDSEDLYNWIHSHGW